MGDRVSVAFRNDGFGDKDEDSIVAFHHWGGTEFPQVALAYATELKGEIESADKRVSTPLTRLEPRVVMVDFIRYLWENGWLVGKTYNDKMEYVKTGRTNDSIYFGIDGGDGDNSDNGHWIVDLRTLELKRV